MTWNFDQSSNSFTLKVKTKDCKTDQGRGILLTKYLINSQV